jgi:glyoxylase-like metal-dependent hydrolase (beta-lactamase superfamily II)
VAIHGAGIFEVAGEYFRVSNALMPTNDAHQPLITPSVESFYDPATSTFTYVVFDREGGRAAIVDPVLDFDPIATRTSTQSADGVLAFLAARRLTADWILETHVHADHLSGAAYLKEKTGAKLAIGRGVAQLQQRFAALFGLEASFPTDGSQFDRLLNDDETFEIGALRGRAMATPGHTEDSLTYVIGDAAFVGDTLFAPDTGTARTDFPGGDARTLYRSIQKLLSLPPHTRLFLCHDYPSSERAVRAETSIADQRQNNIHVKRDVTEEGFVRMRTERDATLAVPKLLLPSLQVNIRAGHLPPPDGNGIRYLRLPLNHVATGRTLL